MTRDKKRAAHHVRSNETWCAALARACRGGVMAAAAAYQTAGLRVHARPVGVQVPPSALLRPLRHGGHP